ncbi:TonB-dependent receptor [Novosphingobium sp. KCTC 2891]|uniref:TonB-dependent receptor n=1 Tax=Novosphingobium sp. KCTC 2891 TaxID=2989730 RepID=UPI0022225C0B|nr:TonB-dependent receptor [Novosphingobium sp. KCTC 2891]MCW1384485.1 TonB-dependent receptor [Novosphingobium sp. KCTC 2891]
MRHRNLSRHLFLATSALAGLAIAAPAHAQSLKPADASEESASTGIDDIVVTARRRNESVQDVPVSVQAISAQVVQQRDLTSLEKIAAATPQFTVARASNGAGAQLTLRGIGSSATSIGIEQSVAIVVDSVYYGQGRVINEGFFDLARVEILKGPQALFYGKNATAGVISLTSADPGREREIMARAGYEFNAHQIYGEAVYSTPISDTLGLRLAVRGSKMFDGYYKNSATVQSYPTYDIATKTLNAHTAEPSATNQPQERELIGRATLKYTPDERLTMTLKASGSYNETTGNGWNYVAVQCPTGVTTLNPAYKCNGGFAIHQNNMPVDIAKVYPYARDNGELYNLYKSWQVTGTVNYELPNVTLNSVTNYNWNNNKFTCDCDFLGGGVWATENSSYHALSQELRALTKFDSPVNLMVGGLYQKTKRTFYQAVMFANIENSAASDAHRYIAYDKDSQTDGETWAAYGQAIWKVLPNLEATAGVRYTHETKVSSFTQPYVNPALYGIFKPQSAAVNGTLYGDQTFNDWSPDLTLSWKPVTDVMVYGAYKTAYKSGGFSNSAINSALALSPARDLAFNPEKGRGFEAGIKTMLFDRQLRANLTLYNFKYTDLQIDYFNAQIFAYVTYNAGAARTKGAELELEYAPRGVPGLSLHGTLNYNRARYENFIAPCYSGQSIAAGCSLTSPEGQPRQDLSGKPTAVAPKWTATAGISYETEVSGGLKVGGNIDTRTSSSYLGSGFGDLTTRQKAYAVLDAGIRVGAADDRWQIAVLGKNLTNKFYFTGGGTAPLTGSGTGTNHAVIGDTLGYGTMPRTVRLQVTVRY